MGATKTLVRQEMVMNNKMEQEELMNEMNSLEMIHCELHERDKAVRRLANIHDRLYELRYKLAFHL